MEQPFRLLVKILLLAIRLTWFTTKILDLNIHIQLAMLSLVAIDLCNDIIYCTTRTKPINVFLDLLTIYIYYIAK
jgi:hypothetical protein